MQNASVVLDGREQLFVKCILANIFHVFEHIVRQYNKYEQLKQQQCRLHR